MRNSLFYLLKGIIGGTNLNLKPSFINQFCKGLVRAAVNSSKLNDIFGTRMKKKINKKINFKKDAIVITGGGNSGN
jgi:exopolysaccharide biosynthesis predicted pyruvyltransferase EpsI